MVAVPDVERVTVMSSQGALEAVEVSVTLVLELSLIEISDTVRLTSIPADTRQVDPVDTSLATTFGPPPSLPQPARSSNIRTI